MNPSHRRMTLLNRSCALLDRGIEPLKRWIREDLAHAPRWMGFHVTTEWDNNVLACYLSHFLPKLPPRSDYWQQDMLVVHKPEHWENGEYNRISTQLSGNCLIPETFHAFLLDLTRAFEHWFIPVQDLRFWLVHGLPPEQASSSGLHNGWTIAVSPYRPVFAAYAYVGEIGMRTHWF